MIDSKTRAALLAARRTAGYDQVDPYLFGVDVGDAPAVSEFQRRHGLDATGDVDAPTRAALPVAQHQGLIDAVAPEAVRRFQSQHGLTVIGEVGHATSLAFASVRAEGGAPNGSSGDAGARVDPVRAWHELDPTSAMSVRTFQASLGLPADGAVGPATRGAMKPMRAWLLVDPADSSAIRAFQQRCEPSDRCGRVPTTPGRRAIARHVPGADRLTSGPPSVGRKSRPILTLA